MNELDSFIEKHFVKKPSTAGEVIQAPTHQLFSKYKKGNLYIPNNEYDEFMRLYYTHVLKTGLTGNLIERQLTHKQAESGHNLIDLDFNFSADRTSRHYTRKHIQQVFDFVLNKYIEIYELDEDVQFVMLAMEKPSPRVVTKNGTSIVKDGIHLMFTLKISPFVQMYIRDRLIEYIQDEWSDLPIINSWEDVVDKAISDGTNGWLLPQSKKEDEPSHYTITTAYRVYYDTDSNNFEKSALVSSPQDLKPFYHQYYKQLFIRNPSILSLELLTDHGSDMVNQYKTKKTVAHSGVMSPVAQSNFAFGGDDSWQFNLATFRQIRSREDAEQMLESFLANIPSDKHALKACYEYVMILPDTYFGPGSYNKWIKVGLVLFNTSRYLHIVWLLFSAKAPNFSWLTGVDELAEHWSKWSQNIYPIQEKLTMQSLMYWCRNEVYDAYVKVRDGSIDHMIEQSIIGLSVQQLNAKGKHRGSTDYDLASILKKMYEDSFVSSSIKSNEWWFINHHYWMKDDSGTTLRRNISTTMRPLYHNKAMEKTQKAMQIRTAEGTVDTENDEYQLLMAQCNYLREIADRLGNTKDKENIMREAREIFFDRDFTKKLDTRRDLLCFTNGVYDFSTYEFRPGKPEDYISKCTQHEYQELDEELDKENIEEIQNYFRQLFPQKELYDYMWFHFASLILGETERIQALHYYIGVGSNGKSLMISFLELVLGDYATALDATYFTSGRTSRGSATPDIAKLPGVRLAITQEPTEAGKSLVLSEGPMKQLTSGTDKIVFRGLYKDEESFVPQAHSIIAANDFLPVRSQDDGTWRRIRVIRFLSKFVENPNPNDKENPYQFKIDWTIKDKFKKWATVFMGMLIKIAKVQRGLVPMCSIVQKESNAYRRKEDFVSAFLEETFEPCETNPHDRLQKSVVQRLFSDWYTKEYGEKTSNKIQKVYDVLTKKYGELKKHPSPGWDGVRQIRVYAEEPNVEADGTYEDDDGVDDGVDEE